MNFTKYEKYKDSGLDWLGVIPENWELNHIKRYCKNITDGAHTSPDTSSNDFPFLTVVDLKNGELDFTNCLFTSKKDYEALVRNGCNPAINDVLYSKDGTIGETVVIEIDRNFVVGSSFIIIKPNLKKYVPKYLKYSLASSIMQYQARIYVKGAGLPRISIFNLSKLFLSFPTISIQNFISEYLDEKTVQIDKKIELLQVKKEKYQELKKTIIYQTVTKGLDKNIELKNTSIEWLGKIPKHWKLERLKNIFDERISKNLNLKTGEPITTNILSVMKDVGVINHRDKGLIGNKMSEDITNYKLVYPNDIVVNKMNVIIGSVGISKEFGALSVIYIILITKKNCYAKYYDYLFKIRRFQKSLRRIATGILEIREAVNMTLFMAQDLPLPPLKEQIEIADYLDEKTSKINEIILTIDKNIEVLNEFRKTLINDAVTGKIKIAQSENTPYERTAITR